MPKQYISDRISNIATILDLISETAEPNISQDIRKNVWILSCDFSNNPDIYPKCEDNFTKNFTQHFNDLIKNVENSIGGSNGYMDGIFDNGNDKLKEIKNSLQAIKYTINSNNLSDTKNNLIVLQNSFMSCDEPDYQWKLIPDVIDDYETIRDNSRNFCLTRSQSIKDALTWHFDEIINNINEDDLQYIIDSYDTIA